MSFFDDDEPIRATRTRPPADRPRPRRPAPAGGRRPTAAAPDPQTLRTRQGIALGAGVIILFLLIFGINGCLNSRTERALKDYNREVTAIIASSNEQVSAPFFDLMAGGGDAAELQQGVNEVRVVADQDVSRARTIDVPGQMEDAQRYLELTLNLRAEALRKVAERVEAAKATGQDNRQTAEEAVQQIAGQMSALLASDVVYTQRVAPLIKQALDENDITGQTIATSQFLDSIGWLDPDQIAERLGAQRAEGGVGASREPAPGTHGHGIESVAIAGVTLEPGGAVNRITAASGLSFIVKFANQGENDEQDVDVIARIRAPGTKTISVRTTVPATTSQQSATAQIRLDQAPPIGTPSTIEVEVRPVPGEQVLDNNKQEYTALFSR